MKIVGVIQARMGSTRLPGKALKEINGLPIIVHIWRRLLACREVDECVVAWGGDTIHISTLADRYAMRYEAMYDDANLLGRLLGAGEAHNADAILRVRADCLFLDPAKLDNLVRHYRDAYPCRRAVSNWPSRCHSEGLDAEVWSMELLAELDRTPECPREDFGTWAIERKLARQMHEGVAANDGGPHLSIDTQEDFDRATKMIAILESDPRGPFTRDRRIDPFEYVPWRYVETLKTWEATK